MEVYVTIVRYKDPYQTTLKEVWFNKIAARNRCKMPLHYLGEAYEVESYELYKAHLDVHTLLEKGGIDNESEGFTRRP